MFCSPPLEGCQKGGVGRLVFVTVQDQKFCLVSHFVQFSFQHGADAADAGAGSLFLDDFKFAELARVVNVRAASDLPGKITD